jgi:hypothetical protein
VDSTRRRWHTAVALPEAGVPAEASFIVLSRLYWVGPLTVLASVAAVLTVRVAAVALLHPDPTFAPLFWAPPIIDTIFLCGAAVFVFMFVASWTTRPIRTYKTIAAVALILSFVPDFAIVRAGVPWSLALVLMVMHVVAWAVTVTMLTRLTTVPSFGGLEEPDVPVREPRRQGRGGGRSSGVAVAEPEPDHGGRVETDGR